ncbi:relaxase/mobilization nuclease domain-containing protein, partial [Elizabethkingia anophelis]|uniref:relaxase/mobilization nuclease domain-containing protein n=1 Tax=Elizabethkingia anophelis TaxID=1117645 RepID=UPI0004652A6F
ERVFSNEELRDIGKHHLEKLGLSDHQYLMTKHGSTDHPHIHILVNRIDEKGKALNDSHISLKSQAISEKLSKELGLYTAKDWQKVRHLEQLPIKKEIEKSHQYALEHSKNYTEYKELMKGKGIDVIDTINKQGQLQGFKIKHLESGLNFRASEIKEGLGMKDLVLH